MRIPVPARVPLIVVVLAAVVALTAMALTGAGEPSAPRMPTDVGPPTWSAMTAPAAPVRPTVSSAVMALHRDGTETLMVSGSATAVTRKSKGYAYMEPAQNGFHPPRWNRCKPVTYLVNPQGMPKGLGSDIKTALQKVATATGLTFVNGGSTKVVPFSKANWYRPFQGDGRNILAIGFGTAKTIDAFRGGTIGLGGPVYLTWPDRDPEITRGGVVLDSQAGLAPGFAAGGNRGRWGALLLHELGHTMNLGHVKDKRQLMFPTLAPGRAGEYAAGDLAGLNSLRSLPCLPD